ncbi:hypothetical protein F5879DRAFT_988106 [Lentinula edodes]|uniref:uncharacterized protein n=1 Tax=Lentinula edodes TaxID=5353 RepID=UPI001E8E4B25|nr:uncharacterized protein C8R40DRAFT_1176086 [Lentinula edodes]KAH7869975.1 hypothetical protein C8R40DRAFT_1176086 [Lentinula edodes]KAJ3905667.1 hypothetical protein F5879DRAFT_988106 [Lentinula edodes]
MSCGNINVSPSLILPEAAIRSGTDEPRHHNGANKPDYSLSLAVNTWEEDQNLKMWTKSLTESLFNPVELATSNEKHREAIYATSVEAHVEKLHAQCLRLNNWPVSRDGLALLKGQHRTITMEKIVKLQYEISHAKARLAELQSATAVFERQLRSAPLPRVILLYTTSVPYNERRQKLSIHENLPSKVRHNPYDHAKQARGKDSSPRLILRSRISSTPPDPVSITPIIIPPPHSNMTVGNAGWDVSTTKAYRKIAREAVKLHLDIQKPLGDQSPEAHEKARMMIEEIFTELKVHEAHWGTDTLLRDQLKSVKDTEKKKK